MEKCFSNIVWNLVENFKIPYGSSNLRDWGEWYMATMTANLHNRYSGVEEDAMQNTDSPIEAIAYLMLLIALDELEWERGIEEISFDWQKKIGPYRVDFFVKSPFGRVVIECDGHDFHERTKQQAAHDKKRDRYLQKEGYAVLHYTGSEIVSGRINWAEDLLPLLSFKSEATGV